MPPISRPFQPPKLRLGLVGRICCQAVVLGALAAAATAHAAETPACLLELLQSLPPSEALRPGALAGLSGNSRAAGAFAFPADAKHVFVSPDVVIALPASLSPAQRSLGLPLSIHNRTAGAMHILWQDCQYLDRRGTQALAFRGLGVTYPPGAEPKAGTARIQPVRIEPGGTFQGYVFPVTDFDFTTGRVDYSPPKEPVSLYLVLQTPLGGQRRISLRLGASPPPTPVPAASVPAGSR